MSSYKVVYFNGRGRAEVSRMLLTAAGVKFEDHRIADWPAGKADAPLGQLPYLVVDDVKIPQSVAMARFLANRFNLAGKTDIEKAQVDVIIDTITDFQTAFYQKVFAAPDGPERDAAKNAFLVDQSSAHFEKLEKLVGIYGSQGYAVGKELTWADIALQGLSENVPASHANILDKYPSINAIKNTVENHAILGAYIKSRPVTPF